MRNNALYFPYISIPNTAWTLRMLLYWDRLSSIVPIEIANRPEELDGFMRELVGAGLVTMITPAMHLHRVSGFEETFSALLDSRLRARRRLGRLSDRVGKIHIHVEKLGRIPEILAERGVAEQLDGSWYSMDEPIANLFMAYLAVCLGGLPEVDAAPVTHRWEFARLFGNGTRRLHAKKSEHQSAREEIIKCLLPIPEGNVTLTELVEFKSKHGHLLPALRTMVESQSAKIALLPDPEDRVDAIRDFDNECRVRVDELCDAMRLNWKTLAFGTLTPLIAGGLTLASTPHDDRMAYAAAGLSFVGAAYQALASVRGLTPARAQQPLAYVAHARTRLGS
ncbi:hypothetical protein [Burkholderia thailandensis]|uniref:hypothetical protein n=1 Tax=Burkholderia thailandensis TaxID=57975 RepID=UPI0022ABD53F|nr:hypothetical protein [Burkholderia thailandensis]MCZ2900950.1 hypothetical protein [Burkholderia thailandensis]MDD1480970.1 hypothetical protein [Burkholderia thailandensis]MDD1489137.1 hypothetical protein [Burkholderia thailandensis]MDD1493909.1 hypothetical protein [Burkholderia thailandensis]